MIPVSKSSLDSLHLTYLRAETLLSLKSAELVFTTYMEKNQIFTFLNILYYQSDTLTLIILDTEAMFPV